MAKCTEGMVDFGRVGRRMVHGGIAGDGGVMLLRQSDERMLSAAGSERLRAQDWICEPPTPVSRSAAFGLPALIAVGRVPSYRMSKQDSCRSFTGPNSRDGVQNRLNAAAPER